MGLAKVFFQILVFQKPKYELLNANPFDDKARNGISKGVFLD